ncbi:MAG: copper-binding protein [Limisphaerales bacterium]
MKRLNCFLVPLLVVMAGCKPNAAAPEGGAKSYAARGIVRRLADDRHNVTIQHEAIPGYMSAMTMDFPVKNTNELNGISAADEITFKLVVGENDSWIEGVHLVAHHVENAANNARVVQVPPAELKPGDPLPDCELVAEDGSPVRFSDFRGRVVAFTFFFSRCPLPDYCPRMSKNFSETRKLILSTPHAPTNWLLLCISFDPEFDKPEVLSSYAGFYRNGDSNHWLFAAAPANSLARLAPGLDLMIMRNGGNIMSHNLRTVVLDPQGRIYRQLDGNEWTPQQLAGAMLEAARPPAQP